VGERKKERVTKNTIKFMGVIAFVAIIGPGFFASCEMGSKLVVKVTTQKADQTVIEVTRIPSTYYGKYAYVGIRAEGIIPGDVVGISIPKLIDEYGHIECALIDVKGRMLSVSGVAAVAILIHANSDPDSTLLYGGIADNREMYKGSVFVTWSHFTEKNSLAQRCLPRYTLT
jgi:hypothetical protein